MHIFIYFLFLLLLKKRFIYIFLFYCLAKPCLDIQHLHLFRVTFRQGENVIYSASELQKFSEVLKVQYNWIQIMHVLCVLFTLFPYGGCYRTSWVAKYSVRGREIIEYSATLIKVSVILSLSFWVKCKVFWKQPCRQREHAARRQIKQMIHVCTHYNFEVKKCWAVNKMHIFVVVCGKLNMFCRVFHLMFCPYASLSTN